MENLRRWRGRGLLWSVKGLKGEGLGFVGESEVVDGERIEVYRVV